MKKETITHKIVRLSIFLAMGIVLNIIESLIPIPIAIPGIRLGLANTMGLIVLYYYSLTTCTAFTTMSKETFPF